MKAAYYPGCSLEGTARLDYSESMLGVCAALGIRLNEVPDWTCCGATAAHSIRHKAGIGLAARNLGIAGRMDHSNLLVPCPMCYNRLKVATHAVEQGTAGRFAVRIDDMPRIWDLANFFATDDVLEIIRKHIRKPLEGLKVACYYGCMANRPPEVTDEPNWEDPQSMDTIIRTLGGETADWPYKTDCCGASLALSEPEIVFRLAKKLFDMALRSGAEAFVVSCQMCQANLDMYQRQLRKKWGKQYDMPVYYFTELIGVAGEVPETASWLRRHVSDPFALLENLGLLKTRKSSFFKRLWK